MNQFGRNRDSGVYDSGLSSGEGDPKMSQNISRPSGKSIYQQRKQYSQSIASLHDSFQHRVEHVLTCEVDGKQMSTAEDAMERLKMLDSEGRVWGQDVILNVSDGELLLTDIETREELDCFNLHSVLSCSCILNSCSYNSVLALTIREVQARRTCIYLFQCEELRADVLHGHIEKAIERGRHGDEDVNHRNLRNNLENMLSQQVSSPLRRSSPSPRNTLIQPESPPPYQHPPSRHHEEPPWNPRNAPVYEPPPQRQSWQEQGPVDPRPDRRSQEMDMQRDSEILNHVLGDIELFLMTLKETTGYSSVNSTRKSKKKKNKKGPLPPDYEYNDALQKIKYAFNLLGKIGPGMQEPSAPDLVHILFSSLSFIMANSPRKDMAPSVISPLLTQKAINLMNSCVIEQERNTWSSLGDAWMVTRADWPNGKEIPPYTPTFSDGWMPREPLQSQYNPQASNLPMERSSHPSSPRPSPKQTAPIRMRAMYDFIGRNSKELTIMKGDVLEVLDQSKQWWMVKNSSNERGYIPNNVLEPTDVRPATSNQDPKAQGPPVLNPRSSTGEVAAWLRTLGFSKLTVTCFGVLNGEQLMELSRDEMKTVCPEEGGRVFNALHSGSSSPRPGR